MQTRSDRIYETVWVDDLINAWPPDCGEPWYSIFGDVDEDIHEAIILDDQMKDAAKVGDDELWKKLSYQRESRIDMFRLNHEAEHGIFLVWWPKESKLKKIEEAYFYRWMREE